jgi:hypothetical protein
MKKRTLLALLPVFVIAPALGQPLTVIELESRTAEELIPAIRPLIDPGDYLTGRDYALYLKADRATVQTVREAVERLDRQPAQLLISVTTEKTLNQHRSGYAAGGSVEAGDARIRAGDAPPGGGLSVGAGERTSRRTATRTPRVRATEGRPALIQQGVSVPVKTTERRRVNNRVIERERTEYRPVTGGFYVTARLNGDKVRLEIEQRDENLQSGGAINATRLNTSAHGRLGEWIPLGSISQTTNRTDRGPGIRRWARDGRDYTIMIKVDKAADR